MALPADRPGVTALRRRAAWLALPTLLSLTGAAMAIDLAPLWDFSRPDESERRLQAALATASGDDALILRTQIARSHGLRRDFDTARRLLAEMAPALATAGPEAQARHALELGRSWASATHAPEQLTPEAKARASAACDRALAVARAARLDALAIDAIHMRAFIDTAPADQLRWGEQALQIVLASDQPAAKRWEGSIRNNIGVALNQLGRHDEALAQLQQALALRERGGDAGAVHVARWMVAHTLRLLGRADEALAMQLALAQAGDAAGRPDPFVFEELAALYRARGQHDLAGRWAERQRANLPP